MLIYKKLNELINEKLNENVEVKENTWDFSIKEVMCEDEDDVKKKRIRGRRLKRIKN